MSAYSDLVLSTAPVAYWRLGEPAGTTAVDSSGNGHDGTYTNGPLLGQPGLIADTDTAVFFDGVDDHVAVPQDPALQIAGALTVQAWVRQDAAPALNEIVYQGGLTGAGVELFRLETTATGQVRVVWRDTVGAQILVSPPGLIVLGSTHHVVATRSPTFFATLYVDGLPVAQAQLAGPAVGTPTRFWIGTFGSGDLWFPGTIDEVAVHNYDLTPEQVAGLYDLGANGPPPPPPPPPSGGGVTRPARRYHRMGRGISR